MDNSTHEKIRQRMNQTASNMREHIGFLEVLLSFVALAFGLAGIYYRTYWNFSSDQKPYVYITRVEIQDVAQCLYAVVSPIALLLAACSLCVAIIARTCNGFNAAEFAVNISMFMQMFHLFILFTFFIARVMLTVVIFLEFVHSNTDGFMHAAKPWGLVLDIGRIFAHYSIISIVALYLASIKEWRQVYNSGAMDLERMHTITVPFHGNMVLDVV